MSYDHDTAFCFAGAIGAGGLTDDDFQEDLRRAREVVAALRREPGMAEAALMRAARRDDDLAALGERAARLRRSFDEIVVLGTGGASLGGQAVTALAGAAARPIFVDTIDPAEIAALVDRLEAARTGFMVISKSGATAETLAQFLIFRRWVANAGRAPSGHFTVITAPGGRPLRDLASEDAIPILDHDADLGGRYSVFSAVGMLPALIAGLDAGALRRGAASVLDGLDDAADGPPAVGAAIAVGLARRRGVGVSVFMPYGDALLPLAHWFRQLWAESLGKDGAGTTPIVALGTRDQHSQLQLYLGGPRDKMFTLVTLPRAGAGARLVESGGDGAVESDADGTVESGANGAVPAYFAGRTLGDLMDAAQRATAETLASAGLPVRRFHLPRLDEFTLGAMMMHLMLETVIAARILGVDPFTQPEVEFGKDLSRRYLKDGVADKLGDGDAS